MLERAVKQCWLGKKSGRGFYVYDTRRRSGSPRINEALLAALSGGRRPRTADADVIQRRRVLPMVNESARVLAEGVTDSSDTIDLATVLGLGLAPFRGGIAQFARTLEPAPVERRPHAGAVAAEAAA